ncbi:MAG TPA: 4-hydroxy-3-methylbut-2-enyl diphosphate reductase [Thermodesulfobacteriota bacterium]|nr:4-hydroxy-3-methylbut-2-enyl diphosphate reductase [Thermodesulfobacteriota bacterium]
MARVKLAKNAGFCMGVRRAVDMALEEAMKKSGPIYTYGPLIHNPQVLEILEGKGVKTLSGMSVSCPKEGTPVTVIIRAHGVSPGERKELKDSSVRILNATCPHVGKVQGIIQRHAKDGYTTVIVGEKDHAEVIGLLGYANGKGYVVNTLEDLEALPPLERVCLVAQTTQDQKQFQSFAGAIQKRFPEAKVFNTICDSTHRRQDEVLALAKKVEAMVVVGGKQSGNTRRLAKISKEAGIPTFHVETENDLDPQELSRYSVIGVTAGASTPNWLILKVVDRLGRLRLHKGMTYYLENLGRIAAISYIFLALGAGCLAYASVMIQGMQPELSWALVASFYVFSMHVLNRFTDKASERYNQPGRTEFYERWGSWMIFAGVTSAGVALALAWFQGPLPFLLLLAISGLGMIYNIRIFPGGPGKGVRYQRLKDIPGSKTLFVALAWGTVTSILPALAAGEWFLPGTAVAFLFSVILVFARSTLYDFKDIQGDLMVGKETIPIVLGRRKAEVLVVSLLIFLGGLLIMAGPLRWAAPVTPWLLFPLVYVLIYYWLYRQQVVGRGFLFEGVVDGSFILAGVLAFFWSLSQRYF